MDVSVLIAVGKPPAPQAAGRAPQGPPAGGTPRRDEVARSFADMLAAIGQPASDAQVPSDEENVDSSPASVLASNPPATPHQDAVQPGFVPGWAVLSLEVPRGKERAGDTDETPATHADPADADAVVPGVTVPNELVPPVVFAGAQPVASDVSRDTPQDPPRAAEERDPSNPGHDAAPQPVPMAAPIPSSSPAPLPAPAPVFDAMDQSATKSSDCAVPPDIPVGEGRTCIPQSGDERRQPQARVDARVIDTAMNADEAAPDTSSGANLQMPGMSGVPARQDVPVAAAEAHPPRGTGKDRPASTPIPSPPLAGVPSASKEEESTTPGSFFSRDPSDGSHDERTTGGDDTVRGGTPVPVTPPVTVSAHQARVDLHAPPQVSTPLHARGTVLSGAASASPIANETDSLPAGTTMQIVQALRLQVGQRGGTAHIRLEPSHFGELTVTVKVDQGQVSAKLEAEAPAVREWLQNNQSWLRTSLAEQRLTLDRLDVSELAESHRDESRGREHSHGSRDQQPPARRRRPDTGELFEVSA